MQETLSEVPCGSDFLVTNVPPGSYRLDAFLSGAKRENRVRGAVEVDVRDKNLELALPLVRGVDVDVRLVLPENSGPVPLGNVQVRLLATSGLNFADESPITPGTDGKFRIPNVALSDHRILLSGLPPGYLVKETRYNGSALAANILPLNAGAMGHSLEIELDNHPASLSGTVADGDRGLGGARVALVRWPAYAPDVFLSADLRTGDDDGRFQYTGLAPADYRLIAVAPALQDKLDEPHVLERLLARAEKITLGPGAFQNVTIKPVDPSR
jgi:hypothetical protein